MQEYSYKLVNYKKEIIYIHGQLGQNLFFLSTSLNALSDVWLPYEPSCPAFVFGWLARKLYFYAPIGALVSFVPLLFISYIPGSLLVKPRGGPVPFYSRNTTCRYRSFSRAAAASGTGLRQNSKSHGQFALSHRSGWRVDSVIDQR